MANRRKKLYSTSPYTHTLLPLKSNSLNRIDLVIQQQWRRLACVCTRKAHSGPRYAHLLVVSVKENVLSLQFDSFQINRKSLISKRNGFVMVSNQS